MYAKAIYLSSDSSNCFFITFFIACILNKLKIILESGITLCVKQASKIHLICLKFTGISVMLLTYCKSSSPIKISTLFSPKGSLKLSTKK